MALPEMATVTRQPAPIFGREREQSRLRELLDQAISGQGSLVLVSGEAGIGKTTLVTDLTRQAEDDGVLVLSGGCYDLTTTPPYGPWIEALDGYVPNGGLPVLPAWFHDPDELLEIGSQAALFAQTRAFFTAVADIRPHLLLLEDLHWSDPVSLELLRFLGRYVGDQPFLLVGTYRDDELTRRHELYQLLPQLVRESDAQRVHLRSLNQIAVREIVKDRYDLTEADVVRIVEHIWRRSEGNPFFAGELLHGLEDDQVLRYTEEGWELGDLDQVHVPPLLRQVLDARLAGLTTETRSALQIAAVIGQDVLLDLWQTVADLDDTQLDQVIVEATGARLLEEAPGGATLQFSHALLREALYESLILNRRRYHHGQLGELLAATPDSDPDRVAHHFQQAGDPRAATWLVRAGVRAERSYALTMAIEYYENAEELLERQPESLHERGWLLFHISHLLRYVDFERSLAASTEAERLARLVDDPILAAYCKDRQGMAHFRRNPVLAGLRLMGEAVEAFSATTPADFERSHTRVAAIFPQSEIATSGTMATLSQLLLQPSTAINPLISGYVLYLAASGYFREAIAWGEPYVVQVEQLTDVELTIHTFCSDAFQGLALACDALGQPVAAERWRARAITGHRVLNHQIVLIATLFQGLGHLLTYYPDRLVDRERAAVDLSLTVERVNHGFTDVYPPGLLVTPLYLIDGRWDQAVEAITGPWSEWATVSGGVVQAVAGGLIGSERQDQTLIDAAWQAISTILPAGATTEPGSTSAWYAFPPLLRIAAQLALDASELSTAESWIDALECWLDWSDAVIGRSELALLRARCAVALGDYEHARKYAMTSLGLATDPRQPLALLSARRLAGRLELVAKAYDDAAHQLEQALELAEACAAPYERARTLLAMTELAGATGDGASAREMLAEVRAICESLGATRTLNQADEIERQLRDRPEQHPASLSVREVEVLQQVTQGLTNAQIAEQLFISPRTVGQHLRNIYNKLGVSNRAEATRWAVENGLT